MPFRLRSNNPLVRMVSAGVVAFAWYVLIATSIACALIFFSTFDTHAFLTGTEPKNSSDVTNLELVLVVITGLAFNYIFGALFNRFARYLKRKLNRDIEWEKNPF